jgi:hypothetical protein
VRERNCSSVGLGPSFLVWEDGHEISDCGGAQDMKDLGNAIYSFSCVVAATILGIGVADYCFDHQQLTAFLSWAVLAATPWLLGRASFYVLARR